jgi:hypothetical protein
VTRIRILAPALAALCGAATLALACHGGTSATSTTDAAPATSASADPSATPAVSVAPSASARVMPPPPRCRAISVAGTSTMTPIAGSPAALLDAGLGAIVAESADLPDDVWIDLQKGAKLTAKHPHSTRETTFIGPGRVRSCVAHAEEAWVVSGTFDSVPSSGERPGAEEWVVTPFGVVRYASARVDIVVTASKTDVKVTSGVAYSWTDDHASALVPPEALAKDASNIPDGWTRLEDTRAVTLTPKAAAKPEEFAKAAVDRCNVAARAAKALAAAVAGPDASLAQVAPRHVIARHIARAACDVALLRVGVLPASPARDGFYTELKEAEGDWRSGRSRGGHGRHP